MRQIYSSPRMENIERVVALMAEHGIRTSIGNRRAYQGADWKRFSYTAKADRDAWPTVSVVRSEDQTLARRVLRDAGLEPATVSPTSSPPRAESATRACTGARRCA